MARPVVHVVQVGQRFGSLVVVNPDGGLRNRYRQVICKCDCGRDHSVRITLLVNGVSKSCGCGRGKAEKKPLARKPVKRDLTGAIYGRLSVTGDSGERNPQRRVLWDCLCDCGERVKVTTSSLERGITSSCGCLQREKASERRMRDLSGKRFSKLHVLRLAEGHQDRETSYARWLCRCDCGNEHVVQSNHLQNGDVSSCGCWMDVDLSGRRFGKLIAVGESGKSAHGARRWSCVCDCGGLRISLAADLKAGRVISCGCASLEKDTVYMPLRARNLGAAALARRRARARKAGGVFTARQIEELFKKQRGKCANCGCKLTDTNMARDHRKALAKGGSNDILNMELLCRPCNQRKHAKDEISWANENGRLL